VKCAALKIVLPQATACFARPVAPTLNLQPRQSVRRNPPEDPVLFQLNPIYSFTVCFAKLYSSDLFFRGFNQNYMYSCFLIRAT
jgi:hypothetical protein